MNKIIHRILAGFLALSTLVGSWSTAQAQTATSVCTPARGVQFAFFNGALTTEAQARMAIVALEQAYGRQTPAGEPIRYAVYFNHTRGASEFVDAFDQRLSQQASAVAGRLELLYQVVRSQGDWIDALRTAIPEYAAAFSTILDAYRSGLVTVGLSPLGTGQALQNFIEHRGQLDKVILEGQKILIFGHSQGNLYANQAFDYARTKIPEASVKVVHAAPVSVRTTGTHVLADQDMVVSALRTTGSVPNNTNTIATFPNRQPGVNGRTDALGHGLLEIYLNRSLSTSSSLQQAVEAAFNSLVAPAAQAAIGFLTATLTWDGFGDVDLHTREPDGTTVNFISPTGRSGFLDVDNTVSFGPEHYYASCDPTKLQTGVYEFQIANYDGPAGRVATIQIESVEGVLGTRSATLGAPTFSTPSVTLFKVEIFLDPATQRLRARIIDGP